MVGLAFQDWARYRGWLQCLADEHAQAGAAYLDVTSNLFPGEDQPMNLEFADAATETIARNHYAIETFYHYSKVLLDRIADTYFVLFGTEQTTRGSSFRHLLARPGKLPVPLSRTCTNQATRLERIVKYRNDVLEHPSDPRRVFGMAVPEGQASLQPAAVWPVSATTPAPSFPPTELPREILPEIDALIEAFVEVFARNQAKLKRRPVKA